MKHIVSWSGGKDSTATIILAKENNEPIDCILFSEVMFDENTSAELPEHIDFVKNVAIPLFEKWGYKIEILHHEKTYMDYFNQVRVKGKNIGKKVGFPMADKCNVRNCKVKPIDKYLKNNKDCVQYIGIAIDEPKRLHRLSGKKNSLLEKYGYTEEMAYELCEKYGLLSPYYKYSKRGGCWCCPNASKKQLKYVRDNHKDLWMKLLELEKQDNLCGRCFNTQKQQTLHEIDEQLEFEKQQMTIYDFIN